MAALTPYKPKLITRTALGALAGVTFCFFGTPLTAQTTANWQAGSGNWSVASNWNCGMDFPSGCVPNAGITVGISNGGTVILDINATSQRLFLDSSSSLIAGTGTSLSNTGPLTVGLNGQGSLTIQNGGQVTTSGAPFSGVYIGFSAGSAGNVTVNGSGSRLAGDFLTIGDSGQGSLTIQNGGQVTTGGGLFMGFSSGSSGNVMVSGSGSQLTAAFANVGGGGVGTATVNSGGVVNVDSTAIDGGGSVTVSGGGSQWNTPGFLTVGINGQGQLNVQGGGVVTSGQTEIGANSGSMGTVIVSGAGSQWNNSGPLIVGFSGQGSLTLQNGGQVTTSGAPFSGVYVGDLAGSVGDVTVNGAGSRLTGDFVTVGNSGQGSLTIQNGGQVTTGGGLFMGFSSGSSGNVMVSGSGSQLTAAFANVGGAGNGTLILNSGAAGSSATGLTIGGSLASGITATMTLTDTGTKWTNSSGLVIIGQKGKGILNVENGAMFVTSGDLVVGQSGTGTLMITNGGKVNDLNATIASGTAKVDGIGSQWNSSQNLSVGGAGTGKLTVSGGAIVTSGFSSVDGAGSATITGIGSQWQNTALLVGLGGGAGGKLTISAGGIVHSSLGGLVGTNSGTGTATVTGGGSQWNLPFVQIGNGTGISSLSIQNGGTVNSGVTSIGFTSTATVVIAGPGSALISTSLCVGCGGQGTLALSASGRGSSTSGLIIGEAAGVTGTMTLTGSGTKWTNTSGDVLIGDQGTGALAVRSGAIFSTSGDLAVGQDGNGTLTITAGAKVTDVNATVGAVSGSTGNVLVDAGTWTNSGALDIGVNGTGVVTIKDKGHLSAVNTTVGSHGSLIIDPAVVDVLGDFTLLPSGVLQLDIGGITLDLFSQLDISGFGRFQGTIDFDFINGFAPTTGESLDLINALGADFSGATFTIDGLEPGFLYTDSFSNGSFALVAQNDGVSTTATPEPSPVWFLASALIITSIAAWRKNSKARAYRGKRISV
jgi:T5SS/PEP-CTERM-associated repeat protein